MKKIVFTLLMCMLLPLTVFAEKVLVKMTDEDGLETKIEYNQDGRVQRITGNSGDDFLGVEADWSRFNEGMVTINMLSDMGTMPMHVKVDSKGRAVKVTEPFSALNFYEFSYDTNGNLIGMKENLGDMIAEKTLVWEDGNLVKITGTVNEEGNVSTMTTSVQYTDAKHPAPMANKGKVVGGLYSFYFDLDEVGLMSFLQFMGLVGNRCENLPVYAVTQYSGNSPYTYIIDYVLDAEGYPIEAIETENNETIRDYYTWGESQAGLEDIISGERTISGIYDLNGIKLDAPAKGINIVRYSDGSCEKLMVRD